MKRILQIYWLNVISNKDLEKTIIEIDQEVKKKRWMWIEHIFQMDPEANPHLISALSWTPEGKRHRKRSRETCWRATGKEREETGWGSWHQAENRAKKEGG